MSLFFVTDRADAHVARFDALFRTLTPEYEMVRVTYSPEGHPDATISGKQCDSWDSIRQVLSAAGSVVVSGPLDSVSADLCTGTFPHVGVSFATDVMVSAAHDPGELERFHKLVSSLDAVVTDNYATENALISLGAAPERIVRIPWGPDAMSPQRPMSRSECGWPEDRPIVLYPRSLEAHYDPEVFVDALAQLVTSVPDVLAVFVEAGTLVEQTKGKVAKSGLLENVRFEPHRGPDVFRSMMHCADVVVVTPRTDGTSVTVMDAMAMGIPVVSSLTAGSAEWVVDGITGWSFPVGDASALALAIEEVLTADNGLTHSITAQAQRLVEVKAGWEASSARLGEVIRSLMGQH